jgi:hypothetical protein
LNPVRPHIVLVVARGEAVRNFLYSDTLRLLSERTEVTLLSSVDHEAVRKAAGPHIREFLPLGSYQERRPVTRFRTLLHTAHFRWLWSEPVKYYWGLHDARARTVSAKGKRLALKGLARLLAHRPALELGTRLDRWLSWTFRPTRDFERLFERLRPDLVFNCSHVHGEQADLPLRVARVLGIPTAAFIFSWDNLTSRGRLFVPYDYYLMWNEDMRRHLLRLYPKTDPARILVTGTPQFDLHFQPENRWSREKTCRQIGLDPERPYILYCTGTDSDFPEEHRIVETVIRFLQEADWQCRPQLAVRTYIKGTSPEMGALGRRFNHDVVFPAMRWDQRCMLPLPEDGALYTNLLRHAALGINGASTVSLELMMLDKPVINLGLEPPGRRLPGHIRFSRYVEYEHYRPVVDSGGVRVARSLDELRDLIRRGLAEPDRDGPQRRAFIQQMFDGTLDGKAGRRVAETLIGLAGRRAMA